MSIILQMCLVIYISKQIYKIIEILHIHIYFTFYIYILYIGPMQALPEFGFKDVTDHDPQSKCRHTHIINFSIFSYLPRVV